MKLREKLADAILVPLENQGFYIDWNKVEKCEIIAEKFYYCQLQIEQGKWCKTQCEHCKEYYRPLEQERKKEKGL